MVHGRHRIPLRPAIVAPIAVPVALSGCLMLIAPPLLLALVVLGGGVMVVAKRLGLESGAYAALVSSAGFAAMSAHGGTSASGRVLVAAMVVLLACALAADRVRPVPVSRLHEPAPVSPHDPSGAEPPASISTRS